MHDDYELIEPIDRGSWGTVYRAQDLQLDRPVAVKVIDQALVARLAGRPVVWDQLRAAARLAASRRDMTRVIELDSERGWIVSELMAGNLRGHRRLTPRTVASILYRVLRPLKGLHEECSQLHGAIHPGNLFLDEAGSLRLADPRGLSIPDDFALLIAPFGTPADSTDCESECGRDASSTAARHPGAKYLAPEWFSTDFGPIGPPADLYALGVTALELLMGSRFDSLFRGVARGSVNPADAWARWHRDPRLQFPSSATLVAELPDELARVIDGLTAKQVARRFQTAREALESLKSQRTVVSLSGADETPAPANPNDRNHKKRTRIAAVPAKRANAPIGVVLAAPQSAKVAAPTTGQGGNKVTPIGRQSPGRLPPPPEPTLGQYLSRGATLAHDHLARNRATQITLAMVVLMLAASILFANKGSREADVEFRLSPPNVKAARLTVTRIGAKSEGEKVWLDAVSLSPDAPLTKNLPPGRYRIEASASGFQPWMKEPFEVALEGPNPMRIQLDRATRKGIRFLNLDKQLDGKVTITYRGRTTPPSDVELPVEEDVEVVVEAEGYERLPLRLNVPSDAADAYDYSKRLELVPLVPRDQLISVQIKPANVQAAVMMDGHEIKKLQFRATIGPHVLLAQAPGYRSDPKEFVVVVGDTPQIVPLTLTRPTRTLIPRTRPGTVVILRPHGQPELSRKLGNGEKIELDVGARFVARAERDGVLVPPERDVTIEAAGPEDEPQLLEMALDNDERLHLPGLPFVLIRQPGVLLRLGPDDPLYQLFLDQKLSEGWRGAARVGPGSIVPAGFAQVAVDSSGLFGADPESQAIFAAASVAARRIKQNGIAYRQLDQPGNVARVGGFYIASVPVTWAHWVAVMDESDLPEADRRDVRRFVREHGEEAAGGIRYTRWCEYCRRLTERYHATGQITRDWEFSPPSAAEFEYVMKGGVSSAVADPALRPAAGNGSPDETAARLDAWLNVERNLEVIGRQKRPLTVWDPNLMANGPGIILGLASTWTTDSQADRPDSRKVVGPNPQSRPNEPRTLSWNSEWPSPAVFRLPENRVFLMHDVKSWAFWPWRWTLARVDLPPGREVGLYLVLRPVPQTHEADLR